MKNIFSLILLGGAGSLLSGCFLASQQDMSSLQGQLKSLNAAITQMQANQAELASKMDELNQNLSVSNENLSQTGSQLTDWSAKLDDITAVIRPGGQSTSVPAENDEELPVVTAAKPANAVLPSDLFAEAKNHLDKGSYEAAATGFKLYITKYPQSAQADQAYMYMGDAYIAAGQTKKGAIAYATLLQQFPKSKLVPAARLKYALSIVPLGKTDEAKKYLSSVVAEFPTSSEATQAKAELAKLSK